MTSVPKPLKFLQPHYVGLCEYYQGLPDNDFKKEFSDLISVLGITMSEQGSFDSLNYALSGTRQNLESWGNEYLRSLSGEVISKYQEGDADAEGLEFLVDIIAPYQMKHNEETETIDLLIEVNQLEKIIPLCHDQNFK